MPSYVYIVIDSGDVHPSAYTSFEEAKTAVLSKYRNELERQVEEAGDDSPLEGIAEIGESRTGTTELYIERGIFIYIHKLPVSGSGGRRYLKTRKRKNN